MGQFNPSQEKPIENTEFFKLFMPRMYGPAHPKKRSPKFGVARELGQYANTLAEGIQDEYNSQKLKWEIACRNAIQFMRNAIKKRDDLIKEIDNDARRDAEIASLVFGMLTAGSLRFLGAFVQYNYLPNKFNQTVTHLGLNKHGILVRFDQTKEFSKIKASALGGIVQDVGKEAVSLGLKAAAPDPIHEAVSENWVSDMERRFFNMLDENCLMVWNTLAGLKQWVERHPEDPDSFGAVWASFTNSREVKARGLIAEHFNRVRKQLATQWYFFGKDPVSFNQTRIENACERALWAGHVLTRVPNTVEWIEERDGRGGWRRRNRKGLADKIVDRLKHLNVVMAETQKDRGEQGSRVALSREPFPTVKVVDSLDQDKEVTGLKKWAREYIAKLESKGEQYFPEGTQRTLQAF